LKQAGLSIGASPVPGIELARACVAVAILFGISLPAARVQANDSPAGGLDNFPDGDPAPLPVIFSRLDSLDFFYTKSMAASAPRSYAFQLNLGLARNFGNDPFPTRPGRCRRLSISAATLTANRD
jgi:hypothetical protein